MATTRCHPPLFNLLELLFKHLPHRQFNIEYEFTTSHLPSRKMSDSPCVWNSMRLISAEMRYAQIVECEPSHTPDQL
jgi:hypothetical protein